MPGHGIVDRDEINDNKQEFEKQKEERDKTRLANFEALYTDWTTASVERVKLMEKRIARLRGQRFMLRCRVEALYKREFELKQLISQYTVSEYFVDAMRRELAYYSIWETFAQFLRETEYIQSRYPSCRRGYSQYRIEHSDICDGNGNHECYECLTGN